jgi:hypothetical protein
MEFMTNRPRPVYAGKQVSWQDENQQPVTASVGEYINSGRTSDIFLVQFPDKHTSQQLYVIKIPHASSEPDNFEDEFIVLARIDGAMKDRYQLLPIPKAYLTRFDGKKALVMEYLYPSKRWMSANEDAGFQQSAFFDSTTQALDLFKEVHQLGFANRDVKEDNFYWLSDQKRLVVTDWNRCLRRGHELYESIVKETIRTLSILFYELWVDVRPPSPLPPVDAATDERWKNCPRTIRRVVYDSHSATGITIDVIRKRLNWLQHLVNNHQAQSWEDLLNRVNILYKDDAGEIIENREQVLDACDWVEKTKDIPDNLSEEFSNLKELIEQEKHNASWKIRMAEKDVRKKLEESKLIEARDFCLKNLKEIDLPAKEKWELAKWYIIADFLVDLSDDSKLYLTNDDIYSLFPLL